MPGFTMEAVATRAGASKATVYRHWPTRAALLVDAMDRALPPFPPPATGDLRGDLVELLCRLEANLGSRPFPRLMAAFVDAAERDPALAGLQFRLTESRREPVRALLAAARDRGEIPGTADLEVAVDLLAGPAFYRRFIAHRPVPDGHAEAVVDHVLSALRALAER